jgi:DNA-binding NarL/FixJ family response regulator
MSIARVLVADAFKPWREVICRLLENELHLTDAVRQAAHYQPDLVILDVDSPGLSGIEVARQLSQLSPKPNLLFLSMNIDPDIVRAAFAAGAHAYVLKTDAANGFMAISTAK